MEISKWERIITHFQACARGYLMRSAVRRAREDFEEIVKEIDGSLTLLKWTETVISIPHFTDTGGPCIRPCSSTSKQSEPGRGVDAPQSSTPSSEETGGLCGLLKRKEAERDDSGDCLRISPVRGAGGEQRQSTGDTDVGTMESTGRSSTIWSSLELDMNSNSHKGRRQYCLAQEVPRTPEALRRHRNALTMELLWLQQAIDSRKKYLSLKDGLTVT
ncbi:IQ domain-containing protein C [Leuresthes tenuis]|uniref:IQ domain-containing protein C n=1 Tax=Leuresthes tenuis TaxID=355514 RepID=UPI003B514743